MSIFNSYCLGGKSNFCIKGGICIVTYERLLVEAEKEGLQIFENSHIGKLKGLYIDGTITINSNLKNDIEKRCILAEELGHYYKNHGDIRDQSDIRNRKQERLARAWGYRKLVSIKKLIEAFKYGVSNRYELSQFLGVTEEFIEDALKYYSQKYGNQYQIDNYLISFEPLSILVVWE